MVAIIQAIVLAISVLMSAYFPVNVAGSVKKWDPKALEVEINGVMAEHLTLDASNHRN
jgi:hypothetical protein